MSQDHRSKGKQEQILRRLMEAIRKGNYGRFKKRYQGAGLGGRR